MPPSNNNYIDGLGLPPTKNIFVISIKFQCFKLSPCVWSKCFESASVVALPITIQYIFGINFRVKNTEFGIFKFQRKLESTRIEILNT